MFHAQQGWKLFSIAKDTESEEDIAQFNQWALKHRGFKFPLFSEIKDKIKSFEDFSNEHYIVWFID